MKTNKIRVNNSLLWLTLIPSLYLSQTKSSDSAVENWSVHFQSTVIGQQHSGFRALYSGEKSLSSSVEPPAVSLTSTLYIGRKLWKNAAIYINPEISGGKGLSFAQGVAGALNGETYRVGATEPQVFLARFYLQQEIPLGGYEKEEVKDGLNEIGGYTASSRIVLRAGKFAIADFFDDNEYAKDPRSQFMNWSLWANGSWDYPANTRGYTFGAVAELIKPCWEFRLSTVAVPKIANFHLMEYNSKAHSETAEITYKPLWNEHKGFYTVLLSHTRERSASYTEGIDALKAGNSFILGVIDGSVMNPMIDGHKFMAGANISQEITNSLGIFARFGVNDGKYASWAFTEIDNDIHAGCSLKGTRWGRADDVLAAGVVSNGISRAHREFLGQGGQGFILGDGRLNYKRENIFESYYNCRINQFWFLSVDYQFVMNPGYNHDRGPVNVFGLRCHFEM